MSEWRAPCWCALPVTRRLSARSPACAFGTCNGSCGSLASVPSTHVFSTASSVYDARFRKPRRPINHLLCLPHSRTTSLRCWGFAASCAVVHLTALGAHGRRWAVPLATNIGFQS
eukprot:scaffold212267_cov28-Tisochrysis_lutea.AAC.2